jgi:hypothetical protein
MNQKAGSELKGPPRNQAVEDFFESGFLRKRKRGGGEQVLGEWEIGRREGERYTRIQSRSIHALFVTRTSTVERTAQRGQ